MQWVLVEQLTSAVQRTCAEQASPEQPSSRAQPIEELEAVSPQRPPSEPGPLVSVAGLALVPSTEPMRTVALVVSGSRE